MHFKSDLEKILIHKQLWTTKNIEGVAICLSYDDNRYSLA